MNRLTKASIYLIASSISLLTASSCANIGNPSGGPRDEDPPVFVGSNPAPGALNVKNPRVSLRFNELVNVKDAFSKVVVSPVSKSVPKVSSSGRTVNVLFDSLAPNTTYTIDFADAIEDNNENNKLSDFSFSFSTGNQIDSLRISGMVLAADNLEPQPGILVGVEENLADSAFVKLPMVRVAKTDDRGRFTIRGLRDTTYRVFALADRDNDYRYANPEEDIAFHFETVRPYAESTVVKDTVFNPLSGAIDTVTERTRSVFFPNDILLRRFNSGKRAQYLTKYERMDSTRIFLKLNTRSASLPKVSTVVGPDLFVESILEKNAGNDSLIYWLPEPMVRTDSLTLAVEYLRADSAGTLVPKTDTLKFFTNRPFKAKKKKEKPVKITPQDSVMAITLGMRALTSSQHEIYDPVIIQFDTPLSRLDTLAFHIEVMRDTVWRPVPKNALIERADTLSPLLYKIEYPWEYGGKYRLVADTIAGVGIYGKPTRPMTHEFTVKKREDYCSLSLNLQGLDPGVPAFVELLNSSDQPVRSVPVSENHVDFLNIDPGKYYLRVTEDVNGNGVYDPGDYDSQLQPETAYYYPKAINIKKNWDKEETWNVFETAVDLQKPLAIKKNKPQQPKKGKKNDADSGEYEEDDEVFDPTVNPFDPNSRNKRNSRGQRRTGQIRGSGY